MIQYNFFFNEYELSIDILEKAQKVLDKRKMVWCQSEDPEYIFVIGGDGTFIKAVSHYANKIDKVKFVPFKAGGIGYYTNNNLVDETDLILDAIESKNVKEVSYELLEVKVNEDSHYAINEIKIVNEENAIYTDVFIDKEFLYQFHGTGLVFSTSTGSSGYMKATGGALIYNKSGGIYEMNEIFPISTNKYRTINSPLIFSKENKITLSGEIYNQNIIVDTNKILSNAKNIELKLSDKTIKVVTTHNEVSKVSLLRDLFVKDKERLK